MWSSFSYSKTLAKSNFRVPSGFRKKKNTKKKHVLDDHHGLCETDNSQVGSKTSDLDEQTWEIHI